jgi:membrane protein involved in colicin uptake
MPNISVQATAEGMSKFDRRQIMQDAWSIYRRQWIDCRPANEATRKKSFAQALRNAWMWAKHAVAEAQKSLAEKAADRVRELTAELMRIDARPWGMRSHRTAEARDAIQAEITQMSRVLS